LSQNRDDLYDYSSFTQERLEATLKGWNGLGGYHGLLLKKCAELLMGKTILDVGCGLCHLYELLRDKIDRYVGVDNNVSILTMTKKRYPSLELKYCSVYNLTYLDRFDTVYAIGLYRMKPKVALGLNEMIDRATRCVVLTYRNENHPLPLERDVKVEIIDHDIDPQLEIARLTK